MKLALPGSLKGRIFLALAAFVVGCAPGWFFH